jgi:small subunit ribosomal protein S18
MRRRGSDVLSADTVVDYKNIELLERFVDEGGRIRSRRRTRATAKQQRVITRAVKRARFMALLPYAGDHVRLYG